MPDTTRLRQIFAVSQRDVSALMNYIYNKLFNSVMQNASCHANSRLVSHELTNFMKRIPFENWQSFS